MASRRLALLETRFGPPVFIGQCTQPILRIRGMKGGSIDASLSIKESSVPFLQIYDRDGDWALQEYSDAVRNGTPTWIQLEVTGPFRGVICEVISNVA